ncbi:histidine utilization repressor domain protein [Enterobacter hormaechei subsp. xiangfangensis]|nr:histidine utilization repressor domain protein [Enterobacter hormaechei subsp. xiangfangensis]
MKQAISEKTPPARMTINRALRELTDEGLLVRLQGVGTFVAEPKGQSALFEIRSIADEIPPATITGHYENDIPARLKIAARADPAI